GGPRIAGLLHFGPSSRAEQAGPGVRTAPGSSHRAIPWEAEENVRDYELMIVVRPDIDDSQVKGAAERVQSLVTQRGGEITNVQQWGKRRLAYRIQHHAEGMYFVYRVRMEGDAAAEIEHELNLDEQVLRFIVVHLDAVQLEAVKNPPPPMAPRPERRREEPAAVPAAVAAPVAVAAAPAAPAEAPAAPAEAPAAPAEAPAAPAEVPAAAPAVEESAAAAEAPTEAGEAAAEPARATRPRAVKAEAEAEPAAGEAPAATEGEA